MPLQAMQEMLDRALRGGYAVGYFEPWDQYSMEAVIRAAERRRSPVIIGCGGIMMNQEWFDGGGMQALAAAGRTLAERCAVPTALILNEAVTLEQIARGVACGFNALLLDTSHLDFEENVRKTREVVRLARPAGAAVEAELGHLPFGAAEPDGAGPQEAGGGAPGDGEQESTGRGPSSLTDPDQAAEFVERTGVDALAVSIGNVHVQLHGTSTVDLDLLGRIREKVHVPLVIHGFTGFPEAAIKEAVSLGVAKFNVGTVLKKLFLEGLRDTLAGTPPGENPQMVVGSRGGRDVVARACKGVQREVERLIALFLGEAGS
ncbi:MAG: class II fructose-bisphosphate aldolase [Spirochaetota bacterium]